MRIRKHRECDRDMDIKRKSIETKIEYKKTRGRERCGQKESNYGECESEQNCWIENREQEKEKKREVGRNCKTIEREWKGVKLLNIE